MGVSDAGDMSSNTPAASIPGSHRGTLVVDPSNPAHIALVAQLPGWHVVPANEAVGLDFLDATRVCIADWRLFGHLEHLRELMLRERGSIICLAGLSGEDVGSDESLAELRRYAGEVITVAEHGQAQGDGAQWTGRLMVPVTSVGLAGVAFAIQQAMTRQPEDLGAIDVHLREAQGYVGRNDDAGAFLSAARALSMAPDQPGIVADVARLLARMGRSAEGEQLCKVFLLQRPDSEPVKRALTELHPVGS